MNRSVRIRKSRKGHNSKFTSCTKWGQMNQTDTVGVLTPTLQVCVRSSVDGIQVFRPFNHHRTHTHCSMRSDPGSAMECAVAADFSLRHSQPASPDRGRPRRAQAQSPPTPFLCPHSRDRPGRDSVCCPPRGRSQAGTAEALAGVSWPEDLALLLLAVSRGTHSGGVFWRFLVI